MSEKLLHFIWRHQYFNKSHLTTTSGEPILIINPGLYNNDQGPDFFNAKIHIGGTLWAGTDELHVKSSDWQRHGHQSDSNYSNVILHVVWEDDLSAVSKPMAGGSAEGLPKTDALPVLELKSLVPKILLHRYKELMNAESFIPCEKIAHTVKDITWQSWKDRLLAERLIRKSKTVETYLQQNNYHWEETFWWLLARNFGMKVNADAFEAIARSVPFNLLTRYSNRVVQLEALLMGRAGLLKKEYTDEYASLLNREYALYYRYDELNYKSPSFRAPFFLRIRPGSFPTTRLAQLVTIFHTSAHLFSEIKEMTVLKEVKKLFKVAASDYWDHHYRFDKLSRYKKKIVGDAMIDNIIINTVVPMLFTYGNFHQQEKYREKALQWLEEITAENNTIIRGFEKAGIHSRTACDTQSLIELKNEYCNQKRCLDCAIGNAILKQ